MKRIINSILISCEKNKHWLYFIIFCIFIAILWNIKNKNFWENTIVSSFELYLFGAFSWAMIDYFKKR